MNDFNDYLLKISDLINWTALEKKAGLPPKTMYKHFSNAQPLPVKHIPEIVRVLCETFGSIQIGLKSIQFDSGAFFWQSPLTDKDVEIKEVGKGFEYLQPQARGVCDAWDVLQMFE